QHGNAPSTRGPREEPGGIPAVRTHDRNHAAVLRCTSSWRTWASRNFTSARTSNQPGSNSARPNEKRAEVGAAWWLLCNPSPAVISASDCRLVAEFEYGCVPRV